MSEPNQEPTMEEILASIRRIISEDEAPPESAEPETVEPELVAEPEPVAAAPEPEPEPVVAHVEEEDVLELTQRVEPPAETHGDIDVYAAPEPAPQPAPQPVFSPSEEESLVGAASAGIAASAFGHLAQTVSMPRDGRTLEDVVRELLRPLLKAWLDEHLPNIVQAKVEAEVERIARGRMR